MENPPSALVVWTSWNTLTNCKKGHPTKKLIEDLYKKMESLKKNPRLFCTLLDVKVSKEQEQEANCAGVTLITATRRKWSNSKDDPPALQWLINHDIYYPHLKDLQNIRWVIGYIDKTKNAAAAIHEDLFPHARLHLVPFPAIALFIFHSWRKDGYGLVGYHRALVHDFCKRKDVTCEVLRAYSTVLDEKITDEQEEDAVSCGVTLIPAQRKKWSEPDKDHPQLGWLLNHEIYYPDLKNLENVKYVVGYAPMTGTAAADIAEGVFPSAKLVLINHAYPEKNCLLINDDEIPQIEERMLQVAGKAALLFSIGPQIHSYFENAYRADIDGKDLSVIPHKEILPSLEHIYFKKDPVRNIPVQHHKILTYGQLCTKEALEKCKQISSAIKCTVDFKKETRSCTPEWKIATSEKLDKTTQEILIKGLKQHVQCLYNCMSNEKLLRHLHQCHLCLPAPCYTDYSLGGLESIAVGVPTMVFDDTHTASFITKYFLEHEENCIIRWQSESHSNYKQLSEKILSALVNMDTAFEKAKTLKNNLLNSKAILESHARFASLLRLESDAEENGKEHTGVRDNTGKCEARESSIFSGEAKPLTDISTAREVEEESKATQFQHRAKKETPVAPIGQNWPEPLKEADKEAAQTIVTKDVSVRKKAAREEMMQESDFHGEHSGWTGYKMQGKETEKVHNDKKPTTQEQTGTDANGNQQAPSERGGDGDIGNYNKLQVNINLKEDDFEQQNSNQDKAKETWSTVNAQFDRNADTVVVFKQNRQMAENICKRLVGDVETTGITTESLCLQLRLPALFNLYKLEQTCRSGSFPSAFEPLLVTNKMKEEAAKVGIQLKLKATYDEERFRELELFFLNRDGGGLEPVEAHLEDVDDLSEEEVFTPLLLLEIDPALETKQSVIRRIFNADKCTRLRGPNSTIMQLTLEITEKVHHILCCRPQILALLGVKRYLVAEPETIESTFSALEDNLAVYGTCVSPQNVEGDNCSLCVKSLLPFQMSSMHLNHYWVEHLLKLGQKLQFLKQQAMVVLQSQLEEAKRERDTLQERYGELQKESDLTEKEFSRRLKKKEMQLRKLKSKVADMEQLQWAEFELQQVTREIAMTGRDDDKKPMERKGAATSDEFHRLTEDAAPGKHSIDIREVEKSEPPYQEIQRTEPVMDKERPLRHGGLETEVAKAKKWKVKGAADLPIAVEKAAVGKKKSVVRQGKEASVLTRRDDLTTEPSDMPVTSTVEETRHARPHISEEMPRRASKGTFPVTSGPRESPGNWSLKVLDGHGRKMIRKFKDVKGIAFNCDQLVVCDQGNSTVEMLTRDYIRQEVLGSFEGQFDNAIKPADVAISPDNLIYILDKGNAQIIVCNLSNEILDKIPLPRDVDPKCIALMGKFVLVCDNNSHRLIKLTHDGQHSADVGGKGSGPNKFIHPNFVAVTSKNVVMVSDGNNHAIKCFDEQLQYLYQFGVRGGGEGELRFPSGICIDEEDNVYVCDCYNHRVVKWRPNGKWVCNLFQGELTNPWNCTISVDRIAIRELYRSQIKVFTKQ